LGKRKQRLDSLLVEQGLVADLDAARRLVGAGSVLVGTQVCDKIGQLVAADSGLTVKAVRGRFASRGGEKLDGGLRAVGIDPDGWVCGDIGCSTGGFTDCLLQHGARKVYSVDVGYGLLDWKLRQDERVVVLERTNARHLTREQIADPLDLAVIDASFISLEPLLAPLLPLFRDVIRIFALVKPQFQLPREAIGAGGIVSDPEQHRQALAMVQRFGEALGLRCAAMVAAPVRGAKGNQEFFMLLTGPSGLVQKERKTEEEGER